MDSIFCSSCGGEISPEAAYCSYCGAENTAAARDNRHPQQTSASVHPSRELTFRNKIKHSGFGIASLVIGVITGGLLFISIMAAGFAVAEQGSNSNDNFFVVIGLFICGGLVVHLLGIILGVVGLAQRSRKQIFPILGTTINVLSLIAVISLLIIGNMMP